LRRCRPRVVVDKLIDGACELVDAGCEPLEAGFEPVERSVRIVHDSSFRPRSLCRIRGSNDRIGVKAAARSNPTRALARWRLRAMNKSPQPRREAWEFPPPGLPLATPRFRHQAWLMFQRALDPLAPPKLLPPRPPPRRRERA